MLKHVLAIGWTSVRPSVRHTLVLCRNDSTYRQTVFTAWYRGVATGWTGVDMSTPLLPEAVPEIDANPVSFYGGGERVEGSVRLGLSLTRQFFRTLISKWPS